MDWSSIWNTFRGQLMDTLNVPQLTLEKHTPKSTNYFWAWKVRHGETEWDTQKVLSDVPRVVSVWNDFRQTVCLHQGGTGGWKMGNRVEVRDDLTPNRIDANQKTSWNLEQRHQQQEPYIPQCLSQPKSLIICSAHFFLLLPSPRDLIRDHRGHDRLLGGSDSHVADVLLLPLCTLAQSQDQETLDF